MTNYEKEKLYEAIKREHEEELKDLLLENIDEYGTQDDVEEAMVKIARRAWREDCENTQEATDEINYLNYVQC